MTNILEIKTSMLSNLDFANNTVSSCFSFFFSIIDLCFLILAVIAQTLNQSPDLVVPIRITIKEAKAEMETHPVIVESKIRSCSI